jgi:hypothetical protein
MGHPWTLIETSLVLAGLCLLALLVYGYLRMWYEMLVKCDSIREYFSGHRRCHGRPGSVFDFDNMVDTSKNWFIFHHGWMAFLALSLLLMRLQHWWVLG